ncbi:O-antigen ligase family protein [Clostridium gasigenes]|nr:O-antigen ligase family protein [Clostridium gasigenes]
MKAMLNEITFNNKYFNIFILFINTSISDALFKSFLIPPSLISIIRLLSNIIFVLIVFYYLLTKRIKMKRYALAIVFIIFIGITLLWAPNKFEAIKLYINFIGPCSYFIIIFCMLDKGEIIDILKKYCNLVIIMDILTLTILSKVGYMGESALEHVGRGIHLSRSTMIIYLNFCIFIYIYFLSYNKKDYKQRNTAILMLALSVTLIVFSKSSTGIVTIGLFLPLLLIVKSKRASKSLVKICIIIGVALPIINFTSPIINNILESIFHKTLTFSGRRYIWDYALDKLTDNPILGNGFESTSYLLNNKIVPIYDRVAAHTHNGFLELFLQSGLIGLILGVLILVITFRYTFKLERKEANVIRVYFIIFIIFNFMEPYIINSASIITMWLPSIYVITLTNKKMRLNKNG